MANIKDNSGKVILINIKFIQEDEDSDFKIKDEQKDEICSWLSKEVHKLADKHIPMEKDNSNKLNFIQLNKTKIITNNRYYALLSPKPIIKSINNIWYSDLNPGKNFLSFKTLGPNKVIIYVSTSEKMTRQLFCQKINKLYGIPLSTLENAANDITSFF
ncbi:unnamed protein product [Gordionus sp. m RMFG-2023]